MLGATSFLFAQTQWRYDTDAEKEFNSALRLYSRGNYKEAGQKFHRLIGRSSHHRTTASYIMLGKCYFNEKRYRESVSLVKKYLDEFHESSYAADAQYLLGLDYFMLRRYDDAANQFLSAVEIGTDQILRRQAESMFETLAEEKLSITLLSGLLDDFRDPRASDIIRIKIAERQIATGNAVMAQRLLDPVASRKPPTEFASRASNLLRKAREGVDMKIGVLLPLMSKTGTMSQKEFAEEFLSGMQWALDERQTRTKLSLRLSLDVRDTERDPSVAREQTEELTSNPGTIAILGPIFSNAASVCADVANRRGVPMISPTANADGIAAIGPYVFQANPDFSTRGKAAARYAFGLSGQHTWAVLAPDDPAAKAMVDSFTEELGRLGGQVLASETYQPNATDLREQFMRIREASMKESADPEISFGEKFSQSQIMQMAEAGARPRFIDSLLERGATAKVSALFGPGGKRIADSLGLNMKIPPIKLDSLEYPAVGIEGIFIPITSSDDIGIVASQKAYYSLKAQILGAGEWYDPVELDQHKLSTNGIVFIADSYVDAQDSSYMKFARNYYDRFKRKPSTNVLFGYDAMHLVLTAIFNGAGTREQLAEALATAQDFHGLHSKITLNPRRVNTELHVLQYRNGTIRKLGEVSLN